MVRHGRLSKGCQTCRKRKIKCDQLLPSCGQCRKAGWMCPQYEDLAERAFQYLDIDSFRTKPKERKHAATRLQPPKPSLEVTSRYSQGPLSSEKIPIAITQSLNDRAIEYFLITNTFRDDNGLRGFYEYLPSVHHTGSSDIVSSSLTATALAAYGNRFRHPDVLDRARRYYGKSLRLVNRALQVPVDAATDCTMISILLLNTFEGLTAESTASMAYSEGHMKGEMLVMSLRGHSLMETRQGLQIFEHMSRCLITYCLIRPAQVPPDVIGLRNHAAKYLDTSDPAWVLEEIMIKLANFHVSVHGGVISAHETIIDLAVKLDEQLCFLAAEMPSGWSFEEIISPGTGQGHFSPRLHIYPSLWTAYIWNYIRTCRLRLKREICTQIADLRATSSTASVRYQNLWLHTRRTIHDLVMDICASVGQYRAQLMGEANKSSVKFNASDAVPTIAGVYFLLWPLLTAGEMTESKVERDWITAQCHLLGRLTGIQRITTVAETLASGGEALL
ncbi:Zn(II)2Cys6 transcription factor domain-containing protein [Aspergillus undulatus]|uniref:Zn(II)2Cys6 transcription factor domain-containing protein n=1 Tax=Aspergillus undulatus TaxID=1810928 RepID=UPI003CCD0795